MKETMEQQLANAMANQEANYRVMRHRAKMIWGWPDMALPTELLMKGVVPNQRVVELGDWDDALLNAVIALANADGYLLACRLSVEANGLARYLFHRFSPPLRKLGERD